MTGPTALPRQATKAAPIRTSAFLSEWAWVSRESASRFRENLCLLLAEIETAVHARDARADAVPRVQVLRPAAL